MLLSSVQTMSTAPGYACTLHIHTVSMRSSARRLISYSKIEHCESLIWEELLSAEVAWKQRTRSLRGCNQCERYDIFRGSHATKKFGDAQQIGWNELERFETAVTHCEVLQIGWYRAEQDAEHPHVRLPFLLDVTERYSVGHEVLCESAGALRRGREERIVTGCERALVERSGMRARLGMYV